jgi:hypothetical protein
VSREDAAGCDGPHKNAVLLLKPLELLKAAQDRLQGYYFLGISHLFDLPTDPNKAYGELWPCLDTALKLFSSINCHNGVTKPRHVLPPESGEMGPLNLRASKVMRLSLLVTRPACGTSRPSFAT